ncbi:MAG TPA: acyl-CoA desaturase [Ignavibacteria bacterium]|nr:acyl-CoA desaturase [Ignavibacteria bacterium]
MHVPKFASANVSFHSELKRRTNEYFTSMGKAPTGNHKLYTKAIVLVLAFIGVYVHLVFFTPPAVIAIIECLTLGLLTASIGFNVMHDGAHGSFSRHKWLNEMAGMSINFLGASVFIWKTKHNIIHHAFTNIDGVDDDIDARPFLRLCHTQKHYWPYKYQHLYFWFIYSWLYLNWVFVADYHKYFRGKVGDIPIKKMKTRNHISFWGFKALHLVMFAVIPIITVGFLPWLIGFLTMTMFAGFVLSIIFQLAHTVDDTHFPLPEQPSNRMEDEWAIHQLKTTANFATQNKVLSWFTGGLNYQIEHHLFPKISHIHYPEISKIIRKACEDFGINYIEYPKMRLAIASHLSYLKSVGQPA